MHAQPGLAVIASRLSVVGAILLVVSDDRECVWKVGMIGAGAVEQELLAFQPLDHDGAVHDDARHRGMGRLGGPATHQALEWFQQRRLRHRRLSLAGDSTVAPDARPSTAAAAATQPPGMPPPPPPPPPPPEDEYDCTVAHTWVPWV